MTPSVETPETFRDPSTSNFATGSVVPIPMLPELVILILSVPLVSIVNVSSSGNLIVVSLSPL